MTTEIEPVKLFQNIEHDSWNSAADYASKEIFVLSTSFTSSIPKIRDWFDEMVQDFFNKQGRTATSEWMILGAKALKWGRLEGWDITQQELIETLVRKQRDYGHHNIAMFGRDGLLIRVHDKIARLENLVGRGAEAANEPIRDTVLDIAGYSTIGIMWDRKQFLLELI
jgi:hypothetical protein